MMADDKSESLVQVGHAIYALLEQLTIYRTKLPDCSANFQTLSLIINESDRFKIWSSGTGLLIPGHGSLDYRVREAENLSLTLHSFLTDLRDNLEEVLALGLQEAVLTEDVDAKDADDSDNGDDGGNDSDDDDVLSILLQTIAEIIDRLFRLATKLRSPETRLRSSRAQNFRVLDDGVDLFQCFSVYDVDFVSSVFQDLWARPKLADAAGRTASPDENLKPSVHDGIPKYLVERIARANVARRRQFAYWKQHHLKLEKHTEAAVAARKISESTNVINVLPTAANLAPVDAVPAMTISTATQLLHPVRDFSDLASIASVSEYMPSQAGECGDVVIFPPPPRVATDSKFFECPYCFTTCARKTSKIKAWQAHLIHDLRPYICTYKDCRIPDQVYDTKADWIHHEITSHAVSWKCPIHPNEVLNDRIAFQLHTADGHLQNVLIEGSAQEVMAADPMDKTSRSCPVCQRSDLPMTQLNNHIAAHLERLAIFSLPRHVGTADHDDDDIDARDSDEANGEVDSRGLDMRSGLSFESSHISLPSERQSSEESARPLSLPALDRTVQRYLQDLAEKEEALGVDHSSTLDAVHNLGSLYARQHNYLPAEQMILRAIAGFERIRGPSGLSTLSAYNSLADLYAKQGRLNLAAERYQRVLVESEKLYGPDRPGTLDAVLNVGKIYFDLGRVDEAVQMFERVLVGRKKHFGSEHNLTFDAVNILGSAYCAQGRVSDARQIYQRALTVYENRLGQNDQQAIHTRNLLDSLRQKDDEVDDVHGMNA